MNHVYHVPGVNVKWYYNTYTQLSVGCLQKTVLSVLTMDECSINDLYLSIGNTKGVKGK